MNHLEDAMQASVVRWAKMRQATAPELELLHHIPNGGRRGLLEAKRLKAQGVVPGIPDLHLPVPRGQYCGLWIEMKAPAGVCSLSQRHIADVLTKYGNLVHTCYSVEDAIEAIESYLKAKQ